MRIAACKQLLYIASTLDEGERIKHIVPVLQKLHVDQNIQVRSNFAGEVLKVCPLLGKKGTNMHVLNIFLQLLRDDSPDVSASLFSQLNSITKVIGVETLQQSVVPGLKTLMENTNWRTRQNCLQLFGKLAREIVRTRGLLLGSALLHKTDSGPDPGCDRG